MLILYRLFNDITRTNLLPQQRLHIIEVTMKHFIIFTLAALGMAYMSTCTANNEAELFSKEGFPYKLLITRADSIKILFIEKEEGIECRTRVIDHQNEYVSEKVLVSKKQFNDKPLASCLSRDKAKELLADTFKYL